jgi:hypothetical protein
MVDQLIRNVLQTSIPKVRGIPIVANIERILQPVTDFVRGNPIVSTATIGAGTTGLIAAVAGVRAARKRTTKKKAAKKTTRRKTTRKRKKKTKAEVRRVRLRNLAKARRARGTRKRSGKRKIIRGRGLGTHEIRHSGKSTKGKMKLVSFRDKRTGKMVRFKARR